MKLNESKHGFVVQRMTEVSELNATMYEMEHTKTHLKLAWLKRDEENKTFGIAFKTLPSDDSGVFPYFRTFGFMWISKISCQRTFCRINEKFNEYFFKCLDF